MYRFPLRSSALALALIAAPLAATLTPTAAAAQSSARDAAAEQFVQTEANEALNILRSGNIGAEKQQFRAFVDRVADVPRISRFVLGKYARSASPQQMAEFEQVFRAYANGVYESRLGQYGGQGLKVTGSIMRKPGDVVVQSQITGPKAQPVQWRVVQSGGGWRVVDVNVAGVWLALTQQQDFVSTLDNNRGDINVLIRQLRSQTAR